MLGTDFKRIIEQVSRDKNINRDVLIQALEEALKSAARKKYGNNIDIESQYNTELGEIEVFRFKEVAEEVVEPEVQISFEEARLLDPECEIGDSLGKKMDTTEFGRIAAQSAKQVIIQKMKDAERDAVYSSYVDRKGEVVNGIVQRVDRGDIIVNLGQTEAVLPRREQVPKEMYRRGDRIRAYILDTLYETRGPQIILSRTHPNFLINLFRMEVPEIIEGIVNIVGAAREPGVRAKFAVSSNDSDIDPVGACVGMKGSRVQNVVQELRGEKIDIIAWNMDAAKYVCNALSPAEISRVIIDEENKMMEVIVPDEFLSIAIGKRGQNVRLASKLTGWRLDVKSEARYNETMRHGYETLVALPNVTVSLADALYEKGFFSAEELSKATAEDLEDIRGLSSDDACQLILSANNWESYIEAAERADARDHEVENELAANDPEFEEAQLSVAFEGLEEETFGDEDEFDEAEDDATADESEFDDDQEVASDDEFDEVISEDGAVNHDNEDDLEGAGEDEPESDESEFEDAPENQAADDIEEETVEDAAPVDEDSEMVRDEAFSDQTIDQDSGEEMDGMDGMDGSDVDDQKDDRETDIDDEIIAQQASTDQSEDAFAKLGSNNQKTGPGAVGQEPSPGDSIQTDR